MDEAQMGDFSWEADAETARTCAAAGHVGLIMTRLQTIAAAVAKGFGFIVHLDAYFIEGRKVGAPHLPDPASIDIG
ncbi:hypothetical protein [Embleya hyalina]|uniref:hypothetical protein n=1 Tax=Embleya hyalina TaxID=516124 RepID=UPI001FE9F36A|nr:hypothetical protein [Embleya hyalina]